MNGREYAELRGITEWLVKAGLWIVSPVAAAFPVGQERKPSEVTPSGVDILGPTLEEDFRRKLALGWTLDEIARGQQETGWIEPWDLTPPDYVVKTQPSEGGMWSWLGDLVSMVKELVPAAVDTWQAIATGQLTSDLERKKAELALDRAKAMQEQKPVTIIEKIPWGTVVAVGAIGLGVYLVVRK